MQTATMNVTRRSGAKKSEVKAQRRCGVVPAVLYGSGGEAEMLNIETASLLPVLKEGRGTTLLIDLNIEGGKEPVKSVIREVQRHPTTRDIIHCDLLKVDMTRKYNVAVPVVIEGESEGVRTYGGIMAVHQREIQILSLPGEIPEKYTIDVTSMMVGDTIRVDEIEKVGNEEFLTAGDAAVVSIAMPRIEEVAKEEEAEGAEEGAEAEGAEEGAASSEGGDEEKKTEES